MLWDVAPLHAHLKCLKFKLLSIFHCFKKYFIPYFFFTISDSFDECLTDLQDIVSRYLGLSSFRPQHQQQHLRLSSINSPFNTRSSMFRLDCPFICFFNVYMKRTSYFGGYFFTFSVFSNILFSNEINKTAVPKHIMD